MAITFIYLTIYRHISVSKHAFNCGWLNLCLLYYTFLVICGYIINRAKPGETWIGLALALLKYILIFTLLFWYLKYFSPAKFQVKQTTLFGWKFLSRFLFFLHMVQDGIRSFPWIYPSICPNLLTYAQVATLGVCDIISFKIYFIFIFDDC